MTRWEPFNAVRKLSTAMDQRLSNAFVPTLGNSQTLPVDVTETDEAYSMQVVVPGINPDDLDITVDARTVRSRANGNARPCPKARPFTSVNAAPADSSARCSFRCRSMLTVRRRTTSTAS